MTDKMTVIFVKETGNVLGAVTHVADPDDELSVEALTPDGLLVRSFVKGATTTGNEQFTVPPKELGVSRVDFEDALLVQPRAFYVKDGKAAQLQAAVNISNVALAPQKVTVSLNIAPAGKVAVWAQIEGGSLAEPSIPTPGTIEGPQTSIVLNLGEPLGSGDYYVLTLVTSLAPDARKQTIP